MIHRPPPTTPMTATRHTTTIPSVVTGEPNEPQTHQVHDVNHNDTQQSRRPKHVRSLPSLKTTTTCNAHVCMQVQQSIDNSHRYQQKTSHTQSPQYVFLIKFLASLIVPKYCQSPVLSCTKNQPSASAKTS